MGLYDKWSLWAVEAKAHHLRRTIVATKISLATERRGDPEPDISRTASGAGCFLKHLFCASGTHLFSTVTYAIVLRS